MQRHIFCSKILKFYSVLFVLQGLHLKKKKIALKYRAVLDLHCYLNILEKVKRGSETLGLAQATLISTN